MNGLTNRQINEKYLYCMINMKLIILFYLYKEHNDAFALLIKYVTWIFLINNTRYIIFGIIFR